MDTGLDTQLASALEEIIESRYSTRGFREERLDEETLERLFRMAQRAPSWCNVQPWRVYLLSDEARVDLSERLMAAREREDAYEIPAPTRFEVVFRDRRREVGFGLYNSLGIERDDIEARRAQAWQNHRFFGAPHVAIITSSRQIGPYGYVDTGLYVAHLLLAARALGLGSIAQAAIAARSDVVRPALGIPDDEEIVAAVSFGWEDTTHPANAFRSARAPLADAIQHVESLRPLTSPDAPGPAPAPRA